MTKTRFCHKHVDSFIVLQGQPIHPTGMVGHHVLHSPAQKQQRALRLGGQPATSRLDEETLPKSGTRGKPVAGFLLLHSSLQIGI